MIGVKLDEDAIEVAWALLDGSKKEIHRALARAINRTNVVIGKEISKTVREGYYVPAKTVKQSLLYNRATAHNLHSIVKSIGRRLPLEEFKVTGGRRGPFSAQVKKAGAPRTVRGVFKYGRHFLHRYKGTRYPLTAAVGPSVPQMVGNDKIINRILPVAERTLNDRFMHEVVWRFGRSGG